MVDEPFISFAQNGEDVVLARAFAPDDHPGFWIDVGAGDPVVDSVTQAFSLRGWAGINIEPCAEQHQLLMAQRPNDINLRCAAGSRAGFAKLYPGPSGNAGLSTLVARIAERHYLREADAPEPVEVEVRTLAELVDQYAPPVVDFLKIDVEGFECEVLSGVNWQCFHPRVVVVEATEPNRSTPTYDEWEPVLLAHDYQFVLFDGLNRFYVAAGEDELARALAAPANPLDNFVLHRSMLEFERAEEHARNLQGALHDQQERTAAELASLRHEFAEAQRYALSLESALTEERVQFDTQLRELARRCRLTSDRAEQAEGLAANLRDDLAAVQVRAALAMREAARLSAHADALEATRTFRYTSRFRAIYGMLRRFSLPRG